MPRYPGRTARARSVPPGARFATERHFPDEVTDTGVSHPDFWLARHSGRDTLNVFGIELTPAVTAGTEPERLYLRQPVEAADALSHFGVTHVVTMRPETANALAADPAAFTTVWRSVQFAVLAVAPPPDGSPDPGLILAASSAADEAVTDFIDAMAKHRHFGRENDPPAA